MIDIWRAAPRMSPNSLCLLLAVWLVLTANQSFWSLFRAVNGATPAALLFAMSLLCALIGLNLFVLRLLAPGRSLRPMLSLIVTTAAITSWFMDSYGVGIDKEMLRNVVQTNSTEARDFLGWSLFWRVAWQAGLPMLLIWRVSLPRSGWLPSTRQYVLGAASGLVLLFAASLPQYVSYASFFRNHTLAQHLIVPANVIVAAVKLGRNALHARVPFVKVGTDARRTAKAASRPLLTLLVVGETARAANFSLGEYLRPTNSRLQQRQVLYFSNVISCGTATAMSVPCMFSDLSREEFDLGVADRRDNVLDMLQRAGLAVSWLDNQDGCKGVCARVPTEQARGYHPASCDEKTCFDDTLLYALDAKLRDLRQDSVLVMHEMGSHGPTYNRRVPSDHIRFTPTCPTERIENCTHEQIVNAYDNTIAYTDYILAGLIDRLKQNQDWLDSVLIYISDHGESLGEAGLYLHGQPYIVAPDVQKRVPMLMWFSAQTPQRLHLDLSCIKARLANPYSQDNLSHTLLGLSDVLTTAYRPQLDVFSGCRYTAT